MREGVIYVEDIDLQIQCNSPDDTDLEQKQAYQDFINVLSAILLKYAAEIELDS